ncbi:MAG: hypothetical protein H6Q86_3323 [candidate division NC10 bacterium]|jgi:hypothetical protein|nr:hypothetical protein [candidate division NC10 bacterium]
MGSEKLLPRGGFPLGRLLATPGALRDSRTTTCSPPSPAMPLATGGISARRTAPKMRCRFGRAFDSSQPIIRPPA